MKTKLQKIKHAIANPPPQRLAKVEYQSHFMQIIGIIIVCTFLIIKGFWYIIFALIFGVGVSYSQGMSALQRYNTIMEFMPKEHPKEFQHDISPSRRAGKITNYIFGSWPKWISIIGSVLFAFFAIDPTLPRWALTGLYPLLIMMGYIVLYYIIFYQLAKLLYYRRFKK